MNLGKPDQAKSSLEEALKLYPIPQTYKNLSRIAIDNQRDFESSKSYLDSGLKFINENSHFKDYAITIDSSYLRNLGVASLMEGYGYYYLQQGEIDTAIQKYEEALAISMNLNRGNHSADILKEIGHIHRRLGNLEKSNEYFVEYIRLNDSLRIINSNSLRVSMRNFIEEEQQPNIPDIAMSLAVGVLITIVLVVGGNHVREKKKIAKTKKEYEDLIERVNQHAPLPNSMSSQGKIQDVGSEVPRRTSPMLSQTEERIFKDLTILEKELFFLENDISLTTLAMRLDTNIKYLSRVVNTRKGKDFNNYINELRVRYIIDKLQTNPEYLNYKLAYIAQEAGFSSHSKFTAVFKSITDLSPSVFITHLKQTNK